MDFSLSEDQKAIRDLARQLFTKLASKERLEEIDKHEVRFDADLWRELAASDLLGIALPEEAGGSGRDFVDLCVVLTELGRAVAPVPLYSTLIAADAIGGHGSADLQQRYLPGVIDGSRMVTMAVTEPSRSLSTSPAVTASRDGDGWRLNGTKELVPAAQLSNHIVVSATADDGRVGLFVVDAAASGVTITPASTTSGQPHADVVLDGVVVADADVVALDDGSALADLIDRAVIGLCAIECGVADAALQLAARYTTEREQFGRPIGAFQAVQQRMADGFIDAQSIRWTMFYAAWLLDEGRPATRDAAIAKFWASEAGARIAATTQQVHGGMGIDITYPLHRYTLWAKHVELMLGAAPAQLARLGATYLEESA